MAILRNPTREKYTVINQNILNDVKLGYLIRKKLRNEKKQFIGYEWIVMETPKLDSPKFDSPNSENRLQYNTKELNITR